MSRKPARLTLALLLSILLALPASAQKDFDPRSGVVVIDPKAFTGRVVAPRSTSPDASNVNTTQNAQAQNETSVDVHPEDIQNILVGGVNDYRPAPNQDVNCGYTRSADGGATWQAGFLAGITKGSGGPFDYDAAGDPSVAFGRNGSAYFACLAFDRDSTRSALVLVVSHDGGQTWSKPTKIVQSNSINLFHDKEMLAVDSNPDSPFLGRLYVIWTAYTNLFTRARIVISYSSDLGATWSEPATLSGNLTAVQGGHVAVGPDGTLYAAWCSSASSCQGDLASTLYVNRSTDGGASWSPPVAAANFIAISSPLPGNLFRTNSFPTVAVNPVNGEVYIAYAAWVNGSADIQFVRSTDQGEHWNNPVRVNSRLRDDQFFQWMDVSPNGVIWVCYYDQSWNTRNWLDVSCSRSTTGTSFGRASRVSSRSSDPRNDGFDGTFIGDYNGLAVGSDDLPRPLWTDTRTRNAEAFTLNP